MIGTLKHRLEKIDKLFSCLFCSHCIEVRSSGPAVTLTITHGNIYNIDLTLAIKDETWPDDAEEWKTRSRRGNHFYNNNTNNTHPTCTYYYYLK
jgi:hypothetical protein